MPFTPLHMGPGVVVKALMRNSFSLVVFGGSQIVIDIQPLVVMLTGKGELHGLSHTVLGATVIGLLCGLLGKPIGERFLKFYVEPKGIPISWRVSFISAFIGTYSHILIDSIMHSDVIPLWPFSKASSLHGIISIDALHVLCLAGVAVGGLAYWAMVKPCKKE